MNMMDILRNNINPKFVMQGHSVYNILSVAINQEYDGDGYRTGYHFELRAMDGGTFSGTVTGSWDK